MQPRFCSWPTCVSVVCPVPPALSLEASSSTRGAGTRAGEESTLPNFDGANASKNTCGGAGTTNAAGNSFSISPMSLKSTKGSHMTSTERASGNARAGADKRVVRRVTRMSTAINLEFANGRLSQSIRKLKFSKDKSAKNISLDQKGALRTKDFCRFHTDVEAFLQS